jgi:hypothetical protein
MFAPRALLVTDAQPEPAYVAQRRAAEPEKIAGADELPAGTVIGGATGDGY